MMFLLKPPFSSGIFQLAMFDIVWLPKGTSYSYLIGGSNPFEKYDLVNWDHYSQYMEKQKMAYQVYGRSMDTVLSGFWSTHLWTRSQVYGRSASNVKGLLEYRTSSSCIHMFNLVPGWWFQPLWKIWKSIGMMPFSLNGKKRKNVQTTNQVRYTWNMSITLLPFYCVFFFFRLIYGF